MTTTHCRGYTDLAVIVGRTMLDAEDLHRRIWKMSPENLIGYDVKLVSMSEGPRAIEGLIFMDCFASQRAKRHRDWPEMRDCLQVGLLRSRYRVPHWRSRRVTFATTPANPAIAVSC